MTTPAVVELRHPTAELITLAGLVSSNTELAVELAQNLDPLDFSTPMGQVVAEAAIRILRGIEPMDVQSLIAAARDVAAERKLPFKATADHIESLFSQDTARALPYAVTVKRFAWLRRAQDFSTWFAGEVADLSDPDDLFAAAQERMMTLHPETKATKFVYGFDTVRDHDKLLRERVAQFKAGTSVAFDWPWVAWNNIVRPLRPGMVGIVAGPDGMGKSTFLEMIGEHWARKANVVFVHMENDFDYTCNRRLTRHSHVPMAAIEDGNLTDAEYARVRDAYQRMTPFVDSLHYLDASGWTMAQLIAELSIRHAEGVCNAVVLDYLNKMRPSREQAKLFGNQPYERQADDMEQLKTWAVQHGAPVLTAAQMNKEGQDAGRKTRKVIRGSGQLSEKSQFVITLDREILESPFFIDANNSIPAGEYSPIVKMRIDKQNRGRTGEFEQFFIGRYFEVRDVQA